MRKDLNNAWTGVQAIADASGMSLERIVDIISTDDNFRFPMGYSDEPVNGDARWARAHSPGTRRHMRMMARKEAGEPAGKAARAAGRRRPT